MRGVLSTVALIVVMALVGSTAAMAGQIDNPAFLKWSKYKAGSSVVAEQRIKKGGVETVNVIQTTLVQISADALTLETSRTTSVGATKTVTPPTKVD
ncbi:MAG: hypothetical protein C0411_21105, partial [Pseudomonas sp.]|nr:hypothetical protein [Pseudomonas sp.]